nr:MAG TPA: hypothetical protein [Caudoviricetes sp.]
MRNFGDFFYARKLLKIELMSFGYRNFNVSK